MHFDGGVDDAGALKDEIILEGPAVEVSREETGTTVTFKISDASTTSPQIVILDSVEVETNHLVEPSIFDKIGALLRRFFNWISSFFTDHPAPGAGAERELALVGRSLPRALTGVSAEQISAVSNPQSGEGQVAQEPISGSATIDHPGLQRLIEEGKNGFSLDDIGKLIASPADLAARLDALDSTPGNVTFDNTSDTDGVHSAEASAPRRPTTPSTQTRRRKKSFGAPASLAARSSSGTVTDGAAPFTCSNRPSSARTGRR